MVNEFINGFFPLAVSKKGAEPGVANLNAADIQHRLENRRIAWIFAADFAAGKTRQRHFADDLLKSILAAQLRHIVVSPANRGDSQFYVIFVHSRGLLPLRLPAQQFTFDEFTGFHCLVFHFSG